MLILKKHLRSLKDGVIADFDITANMMQRFIK